MRRSVLDLMPGETIKWQGTRSWQSMIFGFYVKWGLLIALPMIAMIALDASGQNGIPIGKAIFFTLIAWLFLAAAGLIIRHFTIFTVTDRRVNVRTGFISHRHHGAQLDRIQSVDYDQTLIGKMLNYGTVRIDTAATDEADSSYDMFGVKDAGTRRNEIDELSYAARSAHHGM